MNGAPTILNLKKSAFLWALLFFAALSFCLPSEVSASSFARYYYITASAGEGGSISPSGLVVVRRDKDKTFKIEANEGYKILDVVVDGESVGPVSSYKFSKVNANHTISATFIEEVFTISPSSGPNGTITPSNEVVVKQGGDIEFRMIPDLGFLVEDVLVDGLSVGPVDSYTFTNISADHTISVSFIKPLRVLGVSIPNNSMKIGDMVTANIEVADDGDQLYTMVSGSIGGYPLQNFRRLGSTSYQADFEIYEDGPSYPASADIPVSDLVISDGLDLSPSYDLPISQDNDLLDAMVPVIQSMTAVSGDYGIGDVLPIEIESDGEGYTVNPTSIVNGIMAGESNMVFNELGGGAYRLEYTVGPNDNNVGPGELMATIILVKPSGNFNLPYSNLANTINVSIDTYPPQIAIIEVEDGIVGVGGTVLATIIADGLGYQVAEGTSINGVPVNSPNVGFSERSEGRYELSYLVATGDPNVAPGDLAISVELADPAGNTNLPYTMLEPNSLEIYTDLPTAVLAGPPEICAGDTAELSIFLQGRGPWSVDLYDGFTSTTFENINQEQIIVPVSPIVATTYQVSEVRDVNGVVNTGSNEVQIDMSETTFVEIINLATAYSVDADPVVLEANVPGGIFSGPGVISASGVFDPALADTLHSPHTIYYTYENANGCVSMASKLVYVTGNNGAILIPDSILCENGEPVLVRVINVPGIIGSFSLLDPDLQPALGLSDLGDNTAMIDPTLLSHSNYTIEFEYVDVATITLSETFSLEYVTYPQILNLNDRALCQDAASFELQSDLSNVVFEGTGISGSMSSGYFFDPRENEPGTAYSTCTSISDFGCRASTLDSLNILLTPDVNFGFDISCDTSGGELVSFTNQTAEKSFIASWSWNFGDQGSGQNNHSNLEEPTHHYQETGQRSISLTAVSFDGCVGTFEMDTVIDSRPVADFLWFSDCFNPGSPMVFQNRSTLGSAFVDTMIWTFRSNEGNLLGEIGSGEYADTVSFLFNEANNYQISLYTRNSGGCSNEITKEIMLNPTIRLGHEGYEESFNETEGLWTIHSENQVESWVWAVPDFQGFYQEHGERAWFTQLPASSSGYEEHSWMQSPCFDFKGMDRPLIQMNIMQSFAPSLNGAVLQYREVLDEGWLTIGASRPGIGWYNSSTIVNKPGGSSIGWGSEIFDPDSEWTTAVHDLEQVAGKQGIVFRIAISSNGRKSMGNQGFAFDNVVFAERSKLAVLEHFTNYSDDTSGLADIVIDTFVHSHFNDVVDLHYHMGYPGSDPMNENNPDPSSTRSFNYGVPTVPYSVLDGGTDPSYRYDFSELITSPLDDHLLLLTLQLPAFDLDLSVDWLESGLEARTTVTCLDDMFNDNVQLYLVVFETAVSAYSQNKGDARYRNVVLDMLPTPAGKLLGDQWFEGKTDIRSHAWTYKPYVEDISDLALAAFLQDRNSGRIIQSAVEYLTPMTGERPAISENKNWSVYPNPANNKVFVNLGAVNDLPGRIEILDMHGKVVLSQHIPEGYQIVQLNIDHLNTGMYFLRLDGSDQMSGVKKILKTR